MGSSATQQSAAAGPGPWAEEKASQIAGAIDSMYRAFVAGDQRGFDRHLHPRVTTWETHLPGHLRERSELDAYRNRRDSAGARPQLSRLEAEEKRIDVWGDTAVARYVLVAVPVDAGPEERFRVTDVLRRGAPGWRIVHHHSERVRPEDP